MPEGKKLPAPAPVREEDSYSAKTHLHQPVQETATVAATAQPADAPEGALPSEVRPEIVTWEKLCEAIKASGRAYDMDMIEKAYNLANDAHKGVCRRSGEPYICHPLAVARLVLDLGMDSESIAAALLHDVVEEAIPVTAPIVLVEGNYLLLDQPIWRDLPRDYAVFITADEILLRQRLIERKMRGDKTHEQAALFYQESDGPNVRLCLSSHLPCDLELQLLPNGTFMQRS